MNDGMEYDDEASYGYAGSYGSADKSTSTLLTQMTTKLPPTFDGKTSWFKYEEDIDDWCDITELDPEKRGPALRNRLIEDAAPQRALLDREKLKDPLEGVNYLKRY